MNAVTPFDTPMPVRLTVQDFRLLDDAGAFDRYARTELIEGVIIGMNAQFSAHAWAKTELGFRLEAGLRALASELSIVFEVSLSADNYNQPMPDIVVGRKPKMLTRSPLPLSAVQMAIEVSDSTTAYDLKQKSLLYARMDLPEYWVLDLQKKRIVQMCEPTADGYQSRIETKLGARVTARTISGLTVETDQLI